MAEGGRLGRAAVARPVGRPGVGEAMHDRRAGVGVDAGSSRGAREGNVEGETDGSRSSGAPRASRGPG